MVVKYDVLVAKTRLWQLVAGLTLLLFSIFSGQVMAVNLIVHGFVMCVLRGTYLRNRALMIGLLINGIGFAFFIFSDGNTTRSLLSTQNYFREFIDFGALEKAYFGISLGLY